MAMPVPTQAININVDINGIGESGDETGGYRKVK